MTRELGHLSLIAAKPAYCYCQVSENEGLGKNKGARENKIIPFNLKRLF